MNKYLLILLSFVVFQNCVNAQTEDFLVEKYLQNKSFENPYKQIKYDYTSTEKIPIKLSVMQDISTTDDSLYEGKNIYLVINEDVFYNNKTVVKSGTIVIAKIGYIIPNGMNGVPSKIYLTDFDIPNIKPSQLVTTYYKAGSRKLYIVLPLRFTLAEIPFLGLIADFIKGGHAKITPSDTITIDYYPNWK